MTENEIGAVVIKAAIRIHRTLGPGLFESVYEAALAHELTGWGLRVECQKSFPVHYKGLRLEVGLRTDMIVENKVILELKSVDRIAEVHKKQLQTYLKLTGRRLGYLLNFGSALMKQGIVRCVNGLDRESTEKTTP